MILINNVEILHDMVLLIQTNKKNYIIDVNKIPQHEFDCLRENHSMFVNNISFDKYGVYWSPITDISIDELEFFNKEYPDDKNK